jgi:hypothetical protein
LSGGNQLSSGPTNVSKKSHVRRAVSRNEVISTSDSSFDGSLDSGVLTQRAMYGDNNHSARNGATSHIASRLTRRTAAPVPIAIPRLSTICR